MDARTPLRPFVQLSDWRMLPVATVGSALVALVGYLVLASPVPGLAAAVSTLAGFLAVLGGVLHRWPVERKITVNRQAEVVLYRLAVTLVIYFAIGFLVLWGLNQISPEQARVPLAWDAPMSRAWQTAFLQRVGFWPFYMLVLLGCHLPIPTPPGAC